MSRIVLALLILVAGCGTRQAASSGGSSRPANEEAAAARVSPDCPDDWSLEGIEALITAIQENRRVGMNRQDNFFAITLDPGWQTDCRADPDKCAAELNCFDAILDEVYGPG